MHGGICKADENHPTEEEEAQRAKKKRDEFRYQLKDAGPPEKTGMKIQGNECMACWLGGDAKSRRAEERGA